MYHCPVAGDFPSLSHIAAADVPTVLFGDAVGRRLEFGCGETGSVALQMASKTEMPAAAAAVEAVAGTAAAAAIGAESGAAVAAAVGAGTAAAVVEAGAESGAKTVAVAALDMIGTSAVAAAAVVAGTVVAGLSVNSMGEQNEKQGRE